MQYHKTLVLQKKQFKQFFAGKNDWRTRNT